jgi:CO/xanthine dehydrogenase FAD-binding subunit
MIAEYYRPQTLAAALELLARSEVETVPMGGGTVVNCPASRAVAVVDLQALGLDGLHLRGQVLEVGATVTLQKLLDTPDLPAGLYQALRLEGTHNLRQVATVAGALVAGDGRSPLAVAMLALDVQLSLLPGDEKLSFGDLLPLRASRLRQRLITAIQLPLKAHLVYEQVARTPADRPIVAAALAQWPAGRTRLALGGWGAAPVLAMDGPEAAGLEIAARNACHEAGDEWASAEYRQEVGAVLALRCAEQKL